MNLVILEPRDRLDGRRFAVTDHRAHHIAGVLHGVTGDEIEVGLVDVGAGRARIESCRPDEVILSCPEFQPTPEPTPEIDLICAIPRPKALKRVLTLAATMRIRSVHLVRACRVEKSYLQSPWLRPGRYHGCLLDGLSQGKQTRLPHIETHELFRPFVEDEIPRLWSADDATTRLLADPEANARVRGVLSDRTRVCVVAIGPEGGWVAFEQALFREQGFTPVVLGPWVLRVESAVAAAVAQVVALSGPPNDPAGDQTETNPAPRP